MDFREGPFDGSDQGSGLRARGAGLPHPGTPRRSDPPRQPGFRLPPHPGRGSGRSRQPWHGSIGIGRDGDDEKSASVHSFTRIWLCLPTIYSIYHCLALAWLSPTSATPFACPSRNRTACFGNREAPMAIAVSLPQSNAARQSKRTIWIRWRKLMPTDRDFWHGSGDRRLDFDAKGAASQPLLVAFWGRFLCFSLVFANLRSFHGLRA